MKSEEIQTHIDRVLWGNKYILVQNKEGEEIELMLRSLPLPYKNWVEFIYDSAYKKATKEGLMSKHEAIKSAIAKGDWSDSNEQNIKGLKAQIDKMFNDISNMDNELTSRERKKSEKILRSLQLKYKELTNNRDRLVAHTVETYAEENKIRAIAYGCACKINGEPLWASWDDFLNDNDDVIVTEILNCLVKKEEMTVKEVREVARSGMWRLRWNGAKVIGDLFSKPICDLNNEQLSLIYWSNVYDSVYEAYERPPDHVIEDDDLLDEWFEKQSKKRKEKAKDHKRKNVVSNRIGRHGEIGIVPSRTISVDEIEDLNSPLSKKFLEHQHKKLKQSKVSREEDLRSDPDSRRAIGSQDAIVSKRRQGGRYVKSVDQVLPGGTLKGKNK